MGTTNKSELINMVSSNVDMSKKAVGEVLDSILESIVSSLKNGNDVALKNFCTFKVKHRKARTGVNPQTGSPLQIPAANVPGATFSKTVKQAIK